MTSCSAARTGCSTCATRPPLPRPRPWPSGACSPRRPSAASGCSAPRRRRAAAGTLRLAMSLEQYRTGSATSARRPSPPGQPRAGRRGRPVSWSSATGRRGSTTTSGSRSTACSSAGPCHAARRMRPLERRMAARTEDHPMEYLDFEGVIPKGEYGGGDVIVWDIGTWEPEAETADAAAAARRGRAQVRAPRRAAGGSLGHRAHQRPGRRARAGRRPGPVAADAQARRDRRRGVGHRRASRRRSSAAAPTTRSRPACRPSGTRSKPAAEARIDLSGAVRRSPARVHPADAGDRGGRAVQRPGLAVRDEARRLSGRGGRGATARSGCGPATSRTRRATSRSSPRTEPDLDRRATGHRGRRGGGPRRAGQRRLQPAPGPHRAQGPRHRAAATAATDADARRAGAARAAPLVYHVFDLLYLDGRSLLGVPLEDRKRLLRRVLRDTAQVRYLAHVETDGDRPLRGRARARRGGHHRQAPALDLRRRQAHRAPGSRSRSGASRSWSWSATSRARAPMRDLGSLLVATYEDGAFRYAGEVGSGIDSATRTALRARARRARGGRADRGRPAPVCGAPTGSSRASSSAPSSRSGPPTGCCDRRRSRASSPTGTRGRRPASGPSTPRRRGTSAERSLAPDDGTGTPGGIEHAEALEHGAGRRADAAGRPTAPSTPSPRTSWPRSTRWAQGDLGGRRPHASTSPTSTRCCCPEPGYTKRDLVRYYATIAPVLLPYLRDRALNTDRWPDGVTGHHFWQKQIPSHAPDWVARWDYPEAGKDQSHTYLVADRVATMAWLSNQAVIDLHPWTSRLPDYHAPDLRAHRHRPGAEDDLGRGAWSWRACSGRRWGTWASGACPRSPASGASRCGCRSSRATPTRTRALGGGAVAGGRLDRARPRQLGLGQGRPGRQGAPRLHPERVHQDARRALRGATRGNGRRSPRPSPGTSSTTRSCDPTAGTCARCPTGWRRWATCSRTRSASTRCCPSCSCVATWASGTRRPACPFLRDSCVRDRRPGPFLPPMRPRDARHRPSGVESTILPLMSS